MQPIDKFTNLDAVYYNLDTIQEDIVLDYVWNFAMKIHPAKPMVIDDYVFDGSNMELYKMIGNAVSPAFAKCCAKAVYDVLKKYDK